MENGTSNDVQENKMTFVDSLLSAMFLAKDYGMLLRMSFGKLVRHILFVVALACVIQYAIPALSTIAGLGGMRNIITRELPTFSLEDGKFQLSEKIETVDEEAGLYYLVDTSVKEFTKEDIPKNMVQVFMVSETNMLTYTAVNGINGMISTQKFADMGEVSLNNQMVADRSTSIYAFLAGVFVLLIGSSVVEYLLMALVYAALPYFLFKMLMPDLTYGKTYKIALYALTLGTLVKAVTTCLGGEILYMAGSLFQIMMTIILINRAVMIQFPPKIQNR